MKKQSTKEIKIKLGDTVKDKVTPFTGIVVGITDWLNGCRRVIVQAGALHDGKPVDPQSFDIQSVELVAVTQEVASNPGKGGPMPTPKRF